MKVYKVYKKLGQTPLEALMALRKSKKITDKNLSYVGRLDPMAEGVLLVLQNATLAQREKYLGLPKVYEAEILFGFSSDSFDVLGLPQKQKIRVISNTELEKVVKKYVGKLKLCVPVYSSVPIDGKALHHWAREGMLEGIKIPKKEMEITRIQVRKYNKYLSQQLLQKIERKIAKVSGDFRQERILKAWKKYLTKPGQYQSIKLIIKCGSGTYIRSLSNDLGQKIGTGAILFSLKRLSVGKYKI